MVDCGNPRCLQEKRHLKKELLSWGKKIPFAIGLELVAESLAGTGKIKTLLLPFNDLEPTTAQDWSPTCTLVDSQAVASAVVASSKTCAFCDGLSTAATNLLPGDSQSPSTAGCRSEAEQAPMTPESSADYESTGTFVFGPMATSANVASLTLSALHLPTHIDSDPDSPLDLSSSTAKRCRLPPPPPGSLELREMLAAGDSAIDSRSAAELRVPEVHRVKKKKELPGNNDSSGASPESPFSGGAGAAAAAAAVAAAAAAAAALPTGCGKRAYTEIELRAAVEAIQSGAVGTRRAAQMYGVPRSTLRNKVFKAAEMGQACSPPPAAPGGPHAMCGSGGAASGDLATLARANGAGIPSAAEAAAAATAPANGSSGPQHTIVKEEPTAVNGCGSTGRDEDEAWAKKLQHLRHKHNLGAVRSGSGVLPATALEAFGNIPFGYFGFNPFFLNPYAFDYSYAAAAAAAATSGLLMPYIPDLVKNLTHKRLELERTRCGAGSAAAPSPSPPQQPRQPQQQQRLLPAPGSGAKLEARSSGSCVAVSSDEDLRVPLYRPAAAGDGLSNAAPAAANCSRDGSERSGSVSPAGELAPPATTAASSATAPLSGHARVVPGSLGSGGASHLAQRNGMAAVTAPALSVHPLLKGPATAAAGADSPLNLSSAGRGGSAGSSAGLSESSGRGAASGRRGSKRPPEDDACGTAAGGVSSAAASSSSSPVLGSGPSASAAQPGAGGSTGGPKNKRPKRGQYRKYDSELLAQAVRAVQRGEMSVHRAGTYFGVPHSTLEYKVKERHLLRKKKLAAESAARAAKRSSDDVQVLPPTGSSSSEQAAAVADGAEVGSDAPASTSSGVASGHGATCRSAVWQPAAAAARSGSSSSHRSPSFQPTVADEGFCSSSRSAVVGDAGSAAELPVATTVAVPHPAAVPLSLSSTTGGFALSTPASELLKKLQACANGRSLALPRAATRSQESAANASAASVDVQ